MSAAPALSEPPIVELRDVWKIFGHREKEAMQAIEAEGLGKAEVLQRFNCVVGVAGASFSVPKGEIFCIMGLSGSGKSTLVRHINRLLEPTSGEILVQGENILATSQEKLRETRSRKIGMVFQNFALLPHRTVRDNVALPLEIQGLSKTARREQAQRTIDLVNLTGWEDKYAHELSGGMQQRVGLARALAADPDVLLMDEAFSALDPLIRKQLQDQFLRLSQEVHKTTIFITHDLDEAIRIGHRIAIMKDGEIVQIGTPEEIISKPANDYVASFVGGISQLNTLRARDVIDAAQDAPNPQMNLEPLTSVGADESLDAVMDKLVKDNAPLRVIENGEPLGHITMRDVVVGIRNGHFK